MTVGLAEAPASDGTRPAEASSPADELGFVKRWRVNTADPGVGMPADQTFMIQKIIEPGRSYFKIVPTGDDPGIALDWTQAELVLKEGELTYYFKRLEVDWALGLEPDGSLHAKGTHRLTAEAPGEWDANEE